MDVAAATAQRDRPGRIAQWREGIRRLVRRSWSFFGGLALSAVAIFALVALITYHPSDPSLNTDAAGPVRNWMGSPGAWTSDFLLMVLGPTAATPGPPHGVRCPAAGERPGRGAAAWTGALGRTFGRAALSLFSAVWF